MYAVIETGGKQYRVEVGTELEVELLQAEAGQSVTLERVLLVADGAEAAVGTPLVADATVDAEVVGRERGDKVIAFKYRPKARRRVKKGHRQELTLLRIADIRYQGRSAAKGAAKTPSKPTERKRLEEAAARQAAEDAALAAKLNLSQPTEEAPPPETAQPAETPEPAPKPARRSRTRAATPAAGTTKSDEPAAAKAEPKAAKAEPKAPKTAEPKTAEPKAAKTSEPKAPARRRTRSKATTEGSTKPAKSEAADSGTAGDTPKAAPKRSRTKKDQ